MSTTRSKEKKMRIPIIKSNKGVVLKGYKRKAEEIEDHHVEVFALTFLMRLNDLVKKSHKRIP